MKIDEQEFRSFIANLNLVLEPSLDLSFEDFEIACIKAQNQIDKYKKMLETPKPSRWKQLKIDL